jgi:hypothetical protein
VTIGFVLHAAEVATASTRNRGGDVAIIGLPRTAGARAALMYAVELEHPAVFNHSVRTFLHAAAAARFEGRADMDLETLFLACMLHDLGTAPMHDDYRRFEVGGADAAAEFLQGQGYPAVTVRLVWEAIALHTSPGIAEAWGPIARYTRMGAVRDFGGLPLLGDTQGDDPDVLYPRLDIDSVLPEILIEQARRDPRKAPRSSWAGVLVADLP